MRQAGALESRAGVGQEVKVSLPDNPTAGSQEGRGTGADLSLELHCGAGRKHSHRRDPQEEQEECGYRGRTKDKGMSLALGTVSESTASLTKC